MHASRRARRRLLHVNNPPWWDCFRPPGSLLFPPPALVGTQDPLTPPRLFLWISPSGTPPSPCAKTQPHPPLVVPPFLPPLFDDPSANRSGLDSTIARIVNTAFPTIIPIANPYRCFAPFPVQKPLFPFSPSFLSTPSISQPAHSKPNPVFSR